MSTYEERLRGESEDVFDEGECQFCAMPLGFWEDADGLFVVDCGVGDCGIVGWCLTPPVLPLGDNLYRDIVRRSQPGYLEELLAWVLPAPGPAPGEERP